MLGEKQARQIVERSLAYARSRGVEAEVRIQGTNVATSRFANNEMTQNQAPSHDTLSLRVLGEKRQIRLDTDDVSGNGIKKLVDDALVALPHMGEDHGIPALSGENEGEMLALDGSRFDSQARKFSAADRCHAIKTLIAEAEKHNLLAAGTVSSGVKMESIANTRGLFRYHRETEVESSVTVVADDSSGWAKMHSPRLADLDAHALAQSACGKARQSSNPRPIEPGHYTVVLEPAAVLDLFSYLCWDFAATSHQDRRSCLLDKLGDKVFGSNINIWDDVGHPLQGGAPFDGAGQARKRVPLVEDGVLTSLVYGPRAARQAGVDSTGHGLPEPDSLGEYPLNLVIEGGDTSLDDMVSSFKEGILLTRVWYVRLVDPARKIVTGMTRDGTFMVRDGQLVHGVRNLRFNVSLLELLNNVIELGTSVRTAGEEGFPAVVPPMKIDGFNFTGTTRF